MTGGHPGYREMRVCCSLSAGCGAGAGQHPPRCLSRRSSAPPLLRERGGQGRTCTFSMAQVLLAVTAADRERFGRSGGDSCLRLRPASIRNHPRDNGCRSASLTTSSCRTAFRIGQGRRRRALFGDAAAAWLDPGDLGIARPRRQVSGVTNFFLPRAVLAGRAVGQDDAAGPGDPPGCRSRHSPSTRFGAWPGPHNQPSHLTRVRDRLKIVT